MLITSVETDHLRVPLRRPVTIPSAQDPKSTTHIDVLIVRVLTDSAITGLGMTYVLGPGIEAVRAMVDRFFADVVKGQNPLNSEWLYLRAKPEAETVGFAGAASRAYAAIDFALWDIKGKVAKLPVYQLLGGYRTKLKAIVSDTATPAVGLKVATQETMAFLDAGAAGVQVEVGTMDPDDDADRLRQFRENIPEGAWFEIDAKSRYDFASAVWLGTIGTDEFGLDSFCDPLKGNNTLEFQRMVDRLNVSVCVGGMYDSPEDYFNVITQGAISAIRIDPLRLGGITPARKVAALAELHNIAIYPVRLPEIGTQLAAGSVYGRLCEYVDWFTGVFDGGPKFNNNQLVVADGPGLGLELRADASKYRM